MKITNARSMIESEIDSNYILTLLEKAGRTCYKSEDKITPESAKTFITGIIKSGHETILEHFNVTVRVICDRGVSHEIVRHRIASYSQESTRYCNYTNDKFGNELTVIDIREIMRQEIGKTYHNIGKNKEDVLITSEMVYLWINEWLQAMEDSERHYMNLVNNFCPPQLARGVVTNSTKTEIVMTMNLREWRHFLKLRAIGTTGKPHPQMIEISVPLLGEFKEKIPIVFDDLEVVN